MISNAINAVLPVRRLALPILMLVALAGAALAAATDPIAKDAPQVETYLRKLLGSSQLRIVVKDDKVADILVADKPVGKLERDDDDFTVTLNIPPEAASTDGKTDTPKAERYLRDLFGNQKIGLKVNKSNDIEFQIDSEFEGSLYNDGGATTVMIPLFARDLPATPAMVASNIEPVDSANSVYYARNSGTAVHESAGEDSPVAAKLSEDQRVKVTGRTKNSSASEERWYQVDYADGKPRFVLGKNLLSEKSREAKQKYKTLETTYSAILNQIGNSQGKLTKFMGFYTLGQDCTLNPVQVDAVKGFASTQASSQRLQDRFWGNTSAVFWTDGKQVFRAFVDSGTIMKYNPTFIRAASYGSIGKVELYRLDRVEPPGLDPDLAVSGFAENGKFLANVQINGENIRYRTATRCNNLPNVREAVARYYKNAIARLAVD